MKDIYENMPYDIDSCELNDIAKMVFDHVDRRLPLIECGEATDCKSLFDKVLWDSTTSLEHRFVFDRALSLMVAYGEIDLEFAGVDKDGQTQYVRPLP